MAIGKKIRIYADTSVFGGAFEKEYAGTSQALFRQVLSGGFHLVLSRLLEEEIKGAPEHVRQLFSSMVQVSEMLPITDEALALRDAYIEAGIVTNRSIIYWTFT